MSLSLAIAAAAALAWTYLLLGRDGWWRADVRDDGPLPEPGSWPAVAAVVPARDEAPTVGETVRSLLAQDYPGPFRVVVVDDRSTDGTGEAARLAGAGDPRLLVVPGTGKRPGWTGKLWAQQQGLDALARDDGARPCFLLLTDADIRHDPGSLRRLVCRAAAGRLAMVSLMARLRCESRAERWLVPFFVLFFGMLYPFRRVADPRSRTAGAAGGCVLLRAETLAASGGLEPMRDAMIDDCTLAARIKRHGPIWLGLTDRVTSLRPYAGLGELRRMVARTAYAQLGYSPGMLAGAVLGLGLVFLAPPVLALAAGGAARWFGLASWAVMALAAAPMLRFHGLSPLRGLLTPVVALLYLLFTLDSAWQDWRGRGGAWKGEVRPRATATPALREPRKVA